MNDVTHRLLFVEDNPGLQRQLRWSFSEYSVLMAGDRAAALDFLRRDQPPIVILDLGLPPDDQGASEGLATLEAIMTEAPHTKVIVTTGNEDRANALRAVELGAYDFCQKPVDPDVLRLIIQRARHLQLLEQELRERPTGARDSPLRDFVTSSKLMLDICRIVERVAPSDVTVLLTGESGTGKEVLARALHELSPRAGKPFVAINCAAIPETLLESELFGHEKGSFTGAIKRTIGKFELADSGTLLLDEIGDMPVALQVKLLRFLQERVIERIGGRAPISVDVRVICATNHVLPELVREKQFREDLYYRVNEVSINIPPLRERPGDPLLLAKHFLNESAGRLRRPVTGFNRDAIAAIENHPWPGNVRELQSRIKRAVLMAESKLVTVPDLGLPMSEKTPEAESRPVTLREARQMAERGVILEALAEAEGNISQAAKRLGVSRPTFYDLIKAYGIRV